MKLSMGGGGVRHLSATNDGIFSNQSMENSATKAQQPRLSNQNRMQSATKIQQPWLNIQQPKFSNQGIIFSHRNSATNIQQPRPSIQQPKSSNQGAHIFNKGGPNSQGVVGVGVRRGCFSFFIFVHPYFHFCILSLLLSTNPSPHTNIESAGINKCRFVVNTC